MLLLKPQRSYAQAVQANEEKLYHHKLNVPSAFSTGYVETEVNELYAETYFHIGDV
jgi:hypothetical protein